MDGPFLERITKLLCCVLPLVAAGCADFGGPRWSMNQRPQADQLAHIPTPAAKISVLQKLADRAGWASEKDKQAVVTGLCGAIQTEEDPLIRAEIVSTLGEYACPATDPVMYRALEDKEAEVRLAACEALGKRGGRQAAEKLADKLQVDKNVDVRLAAARALGHSKEQLAVTALGEALEDKDPAMQYRAVLSLREVTGEDFDNDVNRWRQYVSGEHPRPAKPISIAERFRQLF